MNKLDLENLIKRINMRNINIKLIKSNVRYLINIYKKIKNTWNSLNKNLMINNIVDQSTDEYKYIKNIVNVHVLKEYESYNNFIKNNSQIMNILYENISLYYYGNNYEKDLDNIIKLLKITICINKLYLKNDKISRIIVWVPIPKKRDFKYNKINKENLDKSYKNFGAFTASGLTYGDNPRVTIITRYEEIEKLLIHELIHNFYMDGSLYHPYLKNIINNYENIKNKNNIIQNYNYKYSIYESYTELTSTYLNLLFNNINEQIENLENKLLSNIIIEIVYSYNTIVNLIKLNGYNSWEEFIKLEVFLGKICTYEYYYVKGLMYNNFKFRICNNCDNFKTLYNDVINIIQNTKNEKLLINIFNFSIKQENFKYIFI